MDSISFQTRARTIDHLGREQIADCPTAISELWKNSYDAYARKVELNIFDGVVPIATLVDDGHGMSFDEFISKWLVIGTESKATRKNNELADQLGLTLRTKQGQKGIGRLSCAALGSLLLIVSKRVESCFVAALIDWRFFENPFLMLSDVKVPLFQFENKSELKSLLPKMFEELLVNIHGGTDERGDNSHEQRIRSAWKQLDNQELAEYEDSLNEEEFIVSKKNNFKTTRKRILETADNVIFDDRILNTWPVWTGASQHGTAMFMADIHDDMKAQIPLDNKDIGDLSAVKASDSLKETLINFTDPFSKGLEPTISDFRTSVIVWNGHIHRIIIDDVKKFDLSNLEMMEHMIEGDVDEYGDFRGKVKAFGIIYSDIVIKPPRVYKTRSNTQFGKFNIRIASYEYEKPKSTLSDEYVDFLNEQSEYYGGVRIYRDGLRVMPYGREDNDYFEIEKRRSKNAGRYFWSNRRSFGRISITRKENSNLKDKAGREGFLDNTASKYFREIVENILIKTADNYLGRYSDIRKTHIEDMDVLKAIEKAENDRKKLIKNERVRIKKLITENIGELTNKLDDLKDLQIKYSNVDEIVDLLDAKEFKALVSKHNSELQSYSLSSVPNNLGNIESAYKNYKRIEAEAKSIIKTLDESANISLTRLSDKTDYDIAIEVFNEKKRAINQAIRKRASLGKELLQEELGRFTELVEVQLKIFPTEINSFLEDLHLERVSLPQVLKKIDEEYQKQYIENDQRLVPYITAIKNIRDQIDLEGLAIHSMNESAKWKQEAERLNSLAQLGITVEIIGHEIEGLDSTIARGLDSIKNASFNDYEKASFDDVVYAHQGLTDKWRFLSPLKLSGERVKKNISGRDVFGYLNNFFGDSLERNKIHLEVTQNFLNFSVTDFPSRIYPVFINLVNNSRYWVSQGGGDSKNILLDNGEDGVTISDNGPGVDPDDYDQLFTLFFTRKHRGGRGVGLYLCRTNLQPGGHKISYITSGSNKKLSGANFLIEFNEAKK
ncbi:ATP-binding protein [Rahnella sp. PD12R]|uniref:ATP-binding protein n=1 Tax=Rahnella sp. PD12R TaxID=2855688 RepID=UPI001C467A24|nr:ATP-binding protein [Rahnella sp. PD12R]MBV6819010.1 ATP-binding protein [Rahnella sp. PD12R]